MSATWKHIGLHGHSVGTFTVDSNGIQWKSAMTSNHDVSTMRTIPKQAIQGAQWSVFGRSGHVRVQTNGERLKHEFRFDGFPPTDFDKLKTAFSTHLQVDLQKYTMSSTGASFANVAVKNKNLTFSQCILEEANEEGEEFEPRDGPEIMSIDLTEVSQCVLPGNNRNEIEVQFPESDTVEAGTDQLVGLRFYVPPDPDADPSDASPAELLQQRIMRNANIRKTTGDVIVQFDETQGTFLTPRGRYTVELYETYFRMRGNKYDYKIKYDDISRLFLLPKADEVHQAFVISLDKPIRQGQQRYQHLVLQTTKEQAEVHVNLEEGALEKEYNGDLQPVMRGALSNLIAKTFKVIAHKKVFIPGKFANANQQACVKCALRANEGHLYPLEKQFIFIHKPPVLIRFDEVESVEFQRYAGGQGSTRNFDLCVTLKSGASTKEYTFSGIDRSDYTGLYNFLSTKKIRIKNLEGVGMEEARPEAPVYNEDEIYGVAAGEGEEGEEEEDEDYDQAEAVQEEEESDSESDEDDDSLGSISEGSDIAEARKAAKKKRKAEGSNDDDDNNKEEAPKKSKKKKAPAAAASSGAKKKGKKKKKDPNAPKKNKTSYIYFTNSRRDEIKAKNPDISFADLNKQLGAEFKALSAEDKKPWEDMAAADKERYSKEMEDYSAPEDNDEDSDDSGAAKPKKKKAKKDPNAPKKAQSAYNYFMSQNRARIKEANPDATFGDIAKLISVEYKALSSEEKEKYNKMAKADKERYKKEMSDYVPSEKTESKKPKATKESKKKAAKPEKKVEEVEDDSDSDSDEDLIVDDSSDDSDDDSD
jgi:structure-specific recognition protein 1